MFAHGRPTIEDGSLGATVVVVLVEQAKGYKTKIWISVSEVVCAYKLTVLAYVREALMMRGRCTAESSC